MFKGLILLLLTSWLISGCNAPYGKEVTHIDSNTEEISDSAKRIADAMEKFAEMAEKMEKLMDKLLEQDERTPSGTLEDFDQDDEGLGENNDEDDLDE